jgi:hypothetical protein
MPRRGGGGGHSSGSKGKARSAVTGRYVSKATAARWPKNTVIEKK